MTALTRLTLITLGLLGMLGGCAATDPLLSDNVWHPNGANERNIAAQVANPADLVQGREPVGGVDGELAAAPILRLRTGKVKALPDSSISDVGASSAAAPSGGGGS